MATAKDTSMLESLFHNLSKKVDEGFEAVHETIDRKTSGIEEKVCDEIRELRKELSTKLETLDERQVIHEKRIIKVESFGKSVLISLTTGVLVIAAILTVYHNYFLR